MTVLRSPDFILYTQHGWADTNKTMAILARTLATPKTLIVSPDLGFWKTWLWIEPLIEQVEQSVKKTIKIYPHTPLKIIGHSMGGLIWLEVLKRNPELRGKIHSLILLGSPIGGADLARIIDPLGIGIGIARDLGRDRRSLATSIARSIPTLVIAGDIDNGSDGTITVETTKFFGSQFVCLNGISHPALRYHPQVIEIIRDFWANPIIKVSEKSDFTNILIEQLHSVKGMTGAHRKYFSLSKPHLTFKNGIIICIWKNILQVDHIFLTNLEKEYLWGGFVGWVHARSLYRTLKSIEREHDHLIANQ